MYMCVVDFRAYCRRRQEIETSSLTTSTRPSSKAFCANGVKSKNTIPNPQQCIPAQEVAHPTGKCHAVQCHLQLCAAASQSGLMAGAHPSSPQACRGSPWMRTPHGSRKPSRKAAPHHSSARSHRPPTGSRVKAGERTKQLTHASALRPGLAMFGLQ